MSELRDPLDYEEEAPGLFAALAPALTFGAVQAIALDWIEPETLLGRDLPLPWIAAGAAFVIGGWLWRQMLLSRRGATAFRGAMIGLAAGLGFFLLGLALLPLMFLTPWIAAWADDFAFNLPSFFLTMLALPPISLVVFPQVAFFTVVPSLAFGAFWGLGQSDSSPQGR